MEALVLRQDNHIYTSGATGTNAAVIRGALRAEKPHLLTVVLPQSRRRQPPESRELLEQARAPWAFPGEQQPWFAQREPVGLTPSSCATGSRGD